MLNLIVLDRVIQLSLCAVLYNRLLLSVLHKDKTFGYLIQFVLEHDDAFEIHLVGKQGSERVSQSRAECENTQRSHEPTVTKVLLEGDLPRRVDGVCRIAVRGGYQNRRSCSLPRQQAHPRFLGRSRPLSELAPRCQPRTESNY